MDIKPRSKYSSRKSFVLFASHYGIYHSLLFRTVQPNGHDLLSCRHSTVDLIFFGVVYLELPTQIHRLRITQAHDERAHQISLLHDDTHKLLQFVDNSAGSYSAKPVFAIESRGKCYHVIASNCWVLEHNKVTTDSGLSVIGTDKQSLRDEYISSHVKHWYRIEG